jgi:hypothetical protein
MRSHITYANVIATLALFIALGGVSYAALRVTGRDVVDGSLTGKDIKRKSVPVNRLKGKLPAGPAGPGGAAGPQGPQGPKGETGPAGPVDPGRFVPAAGLTTIGVGPSGWETSNASIAAPADRIAATWREFHSTSSSGAGFVNLHPALPSSLAGKAMRLHAATVCAEPGAGMKLDAMFVSTLRGAPAAGIVESPATVQDDTDRTAPFCQRVAFADPVTLQPGDVIDVRVRIAWAATDAAIKISATTFELDRAA